MPTTTKGFRYPSSTDDVRPYEDIQFLASDLDTYLTVKRCRVYLTSAVSTSTATLTLLTFGGESYDTASMHSTSSNTSRIIAPVNGCYDLKVHVSFATSATGRRALSVRKNSAGSSSGGTQISTENVAPAPAGGASVFIATDVVLAANDYIEVFAQQDSGSPLNVNSGEDITYVSMRLVEPT